jgi:chromosome segregation ATPase
MPDEPTGGIPQNADRDQLFRLLETVLGEKQQIESELNSAREQLEKREDRLSLEVLHLEEVNRKLKQERLELQSARESDQHRAAALYEKAHRDYAGKLAPLHQEVEELRSKVQKLETEYDVLQRENAKLQDDANDQRSMVDTLREKQREIAQQPSREQEAIRGLEKDVARWKRKLHECEEREAGLQEKLQQAQHEYEVLKGIKAENASVRTMRETEMRGLQQQCARLQQELESGRAEAELARRSAVAAVKAGATAVMQAQDEVKRLQVAASALERPAEPATSFEDEQQLVLLRDDIQRLQMEIKQHEQTHEAKDMLIAELEGQVATLRKDAAMSRRQWAEERASLTRKVVDAGGGDGSPHARKNKEKEEKDRKDKLSRMQAYMNKQKDDIDRLERKLLSERAKALGKEGKMTELTRTVQSLHGILASSKGDKAFRKGDHANSLPYLVPVNVPTHGPPLPLDRSNPAETLTHVYGGTTPPPGISSADLVLLKPKGAQDYHITGNR